MTEREHHGADSEQAHGAPAADHGSVGKSPLVGEPVATAASGNKSKKEKHGILENLHAALDKEEKKLKGKVIGRIAGLAADKINKLLTGAESDADKAISDHLKLDDKSCLNQDTIDLLVAAFNTKRLFASLRAVTAIDKAVLAEKKSLEGDGSTVEKIGDAFKNGKDVLDAFGKYADELRKANSQYDRMATQAAKCRARINPLFRKVPVPELNTKKFPDSLPIVPDVHAHEHSPPHIHLNLNGTIGIA